MRDVTPNAVASALFVHQGAAGHPMLSHTCAGTQGASGGPLLARESNGTWSIIGIISTAKIGSSGGYAVPIAAVDPKALDAPAEH